MALSSSTEAPSRDFGSPTRSVTSAGMAILGGAGAAAGAAAAAGSAAAGSAAGGAAAGSAGAAAGWNKRGETVILFGQKIK